MTRSAGWAASCLADDNGDTIFHVSRVYSGVARELGSLPYGCDDRAGQGLSQYDEELGNAMLVAEGASLIFPQGFRDAGYRSCRSETNPWTAEPAFLMLSISSGLRGASRMASIPVEPSLTGAPTKASLTPYSP